MQIPVLLPALECFRREDEGVDDAVQPLAYLGQSLDQCRAILDIAHDEQVEIAASRAPTGFGQGTVGEDPVDVLTDRAAGRPLSVRRRRPADDES